MQIMGESVRNRHTEHRNECGDSERVLCIDIGMTLVLQCVKHQDIINEVFQVVKRPRLIFIDTCL